MVGGEGPDVHTQTGLGCDVTATTTVAAAAAVEKKIVYTLIITYFQTFGRRRREMHFPTSAPPTVAIPLPSQPPPPPPLPFPPGRPIRLAARLAHQPTYLPIRRRPFTSGARKQTGGGDFWPSANIWSPAACGPRSLGVCPPLLTYRLHGRLRQ